MRREENDITEVVKCDFCDELRERRKAIVMCKICRIVFARKIARTTIVLNRTIVMMLGIVAVICVAVLSRY